MYSAYLKRRHGRPVYRIGVDAGFTCPNRGKDRAGPGCAYCDVGGSRAPYLGEGASSGPFFGTEASMAARLRAIGQQIDAGTAFVRRRYGVSDFALYFQAFSSTYAPAVDLKELYDYGLECRPFRELVVSTRPDCVDQSKIDLLSSYRRNDRDVWLELGLQSAHDRTLAAVRRGHTYADFKAAFAGARRAGIKIAVHLIFGLPGEGRAEIMETVSRVGALRPDGIKIHDLHIPVGAPLADEYRFGELSLPAQGRHAQYVASALERLPTSTVVMRITCDTTNERRMVPRKPWPKSRMYDEVRRILASWGSRQGRLFEDARCDPDYCSRRSAAENISP